MVTTETIAIEHSLELAGIEQLIQLKGWFNSAEEQQTWGGSGFSYPGNLSTFLQQLCLPGTTGYVLQDLDHTMLGFGQLCDRFDYHHLARLAIAPSLRGKGLAKVLITELILAGLTQQPRDISLYVHRHNQIAINCYLGMGFKPCPLPEATVEPLYFMVLPTTQAIALCQKYLAMPHPDAP